MSSTERQEGELYKRLHESQYVEDSSIVSSYEMEKLFNEAKADLPTVNFHDLSDLCKFGEWVKKWFGE